MRERAEPSPSSELAASPGFTADGFRLRELHPVAKVQIQTFPGRPRLLALEGEDPLFLVRGPHEWLAYSCTQTPSALLVCLREHFGDEDLIYTNVSGAFVVIEASGARVIDILMRTCTLDLEGNALPKMAATTTALAHVTVLLHRMADATVWRIFAERSCAHHLWDWLIDSAGR
jgi:heterotetrameric sarcosine oxidase gamma subunit